MIDLLRLKFIHWLYLIVIMTRQHLIEETNIFIGANPSVFWTPIFEQKLL